MVIVVQIDSCGLRLIFIFIPQYDRSCTRTACRHSHFNDLTLSGRTLAFINHAAIRYPRRIAQANILAHLSKLLTAITIRHRQLGERRLPTVCIFQEKYRPIT